MSIPSTCPHNLDFFGTPIVIEPSPGQLSSDAGLLPSHQFDERIGLTQANACPLSDRHQPELTERTYLERVRARVDDRNGLDARLIHVPGVAVPFFQDGIKGQPQRERV
jgi:hypothetical protein